MSQHVRITHWCQIINWLLQFLVFLGLQSMNDFWVTIVILVFVVSLRDSHSSVTHHRIYYQLSTAARTTVSAPPCPDYFIFIAQHVPVPKYTSPSRLSSCCWKVNCCFIIIHKVATLYWQDQCYSSNSPKLVWIGLFFYSNLHWISVGPDRCRLHITEIWYKLNCVVTGWTDG